VYVLAGRPNPTRFDHLNPGAASAAQLSEAIGDIERARVRVVVVSNFWRAAWGDPAANATLERWIEANFTTTARHDDYEILVRNL
jgi:hypothetical protein